MCVTRHKSKNFYCSAMDAHVRHVHKIPEEVKFYILTHFSIKINLFWSIIYSKITMALANTTKYLAAVNVLRRQLASCILFILLCLSQQELELTAR